MWKSLLYTWFLAKRWVLRKCGLWLADTVEPMPTFHIEPHFEDQGTIPLDDFMSYLEMHKHFYHGFGGNAVYPSAEAYDEIYAERLRRNAWLRHLHTRGPRASQPVRPSVLEMPFDPMELTPYELITIDSPLRTS